MSSRQPNPMRSQAQGTSRAQAGSKSRTDPTSGWSLEEMLETGMDKDGNIIPDPVSYIDGARMSRGEHGSKNQEADEVSASLDNFDE
ncbi:hypothetical protein BJY04DRAFT_175692 [Aspergillus karnatakaensis]|uniref:uncharacterized protein n=1 Tax=Aspergillus karnatakaensis TaxID=1810916 RepID=UPI003CCDFA1C